MPDYPHLHLRNLGRASKDFRPYGGGSTKYPSAVRDRPRHAERLRGQLDEASRQLETIARAQRDSGVELKRRGLPISATARENEGIRVGTLKLNSRGLQLLSLKRTQDGDDVANFFVTKDNIKSLSRALEKYGAYTEGRRPPRFSLFESIAAIRPATVKDLWNDQPGKLPDPDEEVEWEIWVRLDAKKLFVKCARRLKLELVGQAADFVDTAVFNVVGTTDDIEMLIHASAAVVELRAASSFVSEYLDLDPEERIEALGAVTSLATAPGPASAITTLFDTGVNHANPLVGLALRAEDCVAIDPDWPTNDHTGHGTNMAGIALYGDLEQRIDDGLPFELETRLESITVTAPPGEPSIPAYDALEQAVELLADDGKSRVICLAQTAPADFTDGRQSALSGVVDRAAWNDGEDTRLICVAAGNVQANYDKRFPTGPYDQRNAEYKLESPGQAVNALTVGAATQKCSGEWDGVAGEGDLCPSSRTSQQWDIHYAYKPDIVMEGGNHEFDGDEPFSFQTPSTMLLTAGRNYPNRPFDWTGETSAATARAAGLATRLKARYPQFRAETLRAMMVHSADWTPAMLSRRDELKQIGLSKADALTNILQCYGWGIPNEERLFRSAGDALTLVVEDKLQPYKPGSSGGTVLREMKYFVLPWPKDVLRSLGLLDVELRCTLSYFAEPDPHAASRSRSDRYPSHRLRFALKAATDSHLEAQQRVNQFAGEEDVEELEDTETFGISGSGQQQGWTLGDRARRRGTIHHDIWSGPAYELADRDGISVYPVKGWWADRRDDEYHDREVPFSLVLSIRTTRTDVDLYAAALSTVRAGTLVQVAATATTR